jgi:hypothetical protein
LVITKLKNVAGKVVPALVAITLAIRIIPNDYALMAFPIIFGAVLVPMFDSHPTGAPMGIRKQWCGLAFAVLLTGAWFAAIILLSFG